MSSHLPRSRRSLGFRRTPRPRATVTHLQPLKNHSCLMNDFSDLEVELKKLRPTPASQELVTRVECALQQTGAEKTAGLIKKRRVRWNWLPLGLGLAAAAAFLLLARLNMDHAPKSS